MIRDGGEKYRRVIGVRREDMGEMGLNGLLKEMKCWVIGWLREIGCVYGFGFGELGLMGRVMDEEEGDWVR